VTRDRDTSVGGGKAESAEDAELGRALEAYLADLEAGRPDDRERLLAAHPAIARQLRACLQVMNLAERMVDASGSGSRARRPVPRLDSATMPPGQSALTTLCFGSGPPPHVQLRDLPDEPEPLIKPRSAEMPAHDGPTLGRYQLLGEIAHGGMGAILKGRDVDLGRDLALKVLLESHQGNPEVVNRFIEEAQIGGQLQHPGIAPVYELGTFPEPDRRPYFAMKLVKGQTLAALLAERKDRAGRESAGTRRVAALDRAERGSSRAGRGSPDPAHDRAGRGSPDPAHRPTEGLPPAHDDLPRFLSIFEQVCQTMAYAHARGVIHRDLKPSNVMVGSFGEVQVMDWGLAKVLPRGGIADEAGAQPVQETVIMTVRSGSAGSGSESQAGSVLGTPAYMAPEQARGEVERIDERADVFGLGAILCEVLTGRPPFAGSTREAIRAQAARGDMADALRRLDVSGAEAELIALARSCLTAEPEQRPRNAGEVARRMTAHLAGVQERLRAAELARVEAQARAAEERKRRKLTVALAASVLITAGVVGGGWAFLVRQRTARLMVTTRVVTDALAEAERLRGQAQSAAIGDLTKWSEVMAAARHADALLAEGEANDALHQKVAGILAAVGREQAAAEKQAAEVEHDRKLLGELETIRGSRSEHWDPKQSDAEYAAAFRGFGIDLDRLDPKESAKRIAQRSAPVELASYLDDWALQRRNARDKKEEISWRRLHEAARGADADPWRVTLRDQIGREDRAALRRLAADIKSLEDQPAASVVLFSLALVRQGDPDLAEEVLRRAWRLSPADFWVNLELGYVVHGAEMGHVRPEEAARFYSAAVAIRPGSPMAHNNLGSALADQGKLDEAVAELRVALRLRPEFGFAHNNLGIALANQGKLEEAIAQFHAAIRLKSNDVKAHNNLGYALRDQGKLDEAIAEHRIALRLRPDFGSAHNNLGLALANQGKLEEAVAEYRTAIRLKSDDFMAHNNLGLALANQGKLDEAIREYHEALRLKPDDADAYSNLGNALADQGKMDEAIAEHRIAVLLRPDFGSAHSNLGIALAKQKKQEEAIAEFRKAVRLKSDDAKAHFHLGFFLKEQGKLDEAIAESREALRLRPGFLEAHFNLAEVLQRQGKKDEAIAEYRTALRLEPDAPAAHNELGIALAEQGKPEEAIAEYRTALRLKPDNAETHCNLGHVFNQQGHYAEALAAFKRGHELGSKNPNWRYPSAAWVRETERLVELDHKLPAILTGKARPSDALETLGFAQLCSEKKLHGASARLWAEAFQAQPRLAEDMQVQNRYNAACAAALAGSGQGKDDPPLDEGTKARWRKQAIDWLRADLTAWSKLLESGPPQARQPIPETLQHWKADADLSGLRDAAALAKLPENEQQACRGLWAEVDALLAKSHSTNPKQAH